MAKRTKTTELVYDASGDTKERITGLVLENLAAGFGTRATGRMLNIHPAKVDRIKQKHKEELADLTESFGKTVIKEGFARREVRVAKLAETLIELDGKKWELDQYGRPTWYHLWLKTVSELGKLMGDYDITVRHQLSPQLAELVEKLGESQQRITIEAQARIASPTT